MGQLERYGLYGLCLVIFLILGVAIWGEPNEPTEPKTDPGKTALADPAAQQDKFAAMLQKENTRSLEKQRQAEQLFRPVGTDPAGTGGAVANVGVGVGAGTAGTTPAVTPKPAPDPVSTAPVALRTHVVKRGDSLEAISQRYLGEGRLWRTILPLNPGVTERNLQPGTALKIPPRPAKDSGSVSADRRYLVQKGDSAWRIAAREYGESQAPKYSRLILELNGIRDAAALKPGTFISLPKKQN